MNTVPSAAPTPPARTWLAVYDRTGRILHLDAAAIDAVRLEDDGTLTVWRRRDQVGYTVSEPVAVTQRKLALEPRILGQALAAALTGEIREPVASRNHLGGDPQRP
jgi:hypothetical protein